MDAITLLKNDHRTVEALFKKFEKMGDGAGRDKKQVVAQIIRELAIHAAIEEQLFYPAARKALKDDDDIVLESLEEHHVVKWVLSELESMSPKEERFDAKVTVLMENVRHHVEEEQNDLFPKVSKKLNREQLEALGAAMQKAKAFAPTRPHPRAPDTPPGNLVASIPAALMDKVKDLVQGVAKKAQARKTNGARATGTKSVTARTRSAGPTSGGRTKGRSGTASHARTH